MLIVLCVLAANLGFSFDQSNRTVKINIANSIIDTNGCSEPASTPKKFGCDFGDLDSDKLVMLVGDSHASQWFPGFEKASLASGFRFRVATKNGCPALLVSPGNTSPNSECKAWQENVLLYINSSVPDLIVISNLTENGGSFGKLGLTPIQYIESLINFITQIHPKSKVAVIGDTAYPGNDSASCLSLNWENPSKCDILNAKSYATEMTKLASNFRTSYFDPRPLFCTNVICFAVMNGKNVYKDGSHLSISTVDNQEILAREVFRLIK
jgi:hypothetical protein